jgi:hypothetical protein
MANRGWLLALSAVLLGPAVTLAASFRSQNFVVEAPTAEAAQKFGQMAEHYRKEKAVQWLGKEMPNWPQPCPLTVTVTTNGAGGATSFNFQNGNVSQSMQIEGSYERLLNSVLPHEVTHTVFAHHFRRPVPRWADEGGSVLSEDDTERHRHDSLCRSMLNQGRAMPLRRLFGLTEYPSDVMVLYAQGFSVTRYLVELGDRQKFLGFVGTGLASGWDRAAQEYGFKSVDALQEAWIESLRTPRKQPRAVDAETVKNTGVGPAPGELAAREVVRSTAPPAPPTLTPPTLGMPVAVRGQGPEEPAPGRVPAASAYPTGTRPDYLPQVGPGAAPNPISNPTPSSALEIPVTLLPLGSPPAPPR